jgi:hypothetical protein
MGHSAGLRGGVGTLFSGAVHLSNPVDDSQKVDIHGPREIRMDEGHTN